MDVTYTAPPGWPVDPAWVPPEGWKKPSEWPDPPPGWVFFHEPDAATRSPVPCKKRTDKKSETKEWPTRSEARLYADLASLRGIHAIFAMTFAALLVVLAGMVFLWASQAEWPAQAQLQACEDSLRAQYAQTSPASTPTFNPTAVRDSVYSASAVGLTVDGVTNFANESPQAWKCTFVSDPGSADRWIFAEAQIVPSSQRPLNAFGEFSDDPAAPWTRVVATPGTGQTSVGG